MFDWEEESTSATHSFIVKRGIDALGYGVIAAIVALAFILMK